jgi:SAM-dependent methyltransferase
MFLKNTDKQWELWGKKDPYRGVLTQDKFNVKKLDSETLDDFYNSGAKHFEEVSKYIKEHLDRDFSPKKAIDFGCGVGRLIIPLSKLCEEVVGIDVSPSMLAKASDELKKRGIENCQLLKSDDDLSLLNGNFDFIHSHIVFQHIPVKRGEIIISKLLDHLEDGGIGVIQIPYYNQTYFTSRVYRWIASNIPYLYVFKRIFKQQDISAPPPVQMNCYDLSKLFSILRNKGINNVYSNLPLDSNDDKFYGTILYFKK